MGSEDFLLTDPLPPILLLVTLGLFLLSVLANRVFHTETLSKWTFGLCFLTLFLSLELFMFDLVLDSPPLGLSVIDFTKWTVSQFGGWSPCLAALYFCGAIALGVMCLLARFVDAIEPGWYGFPAILLSVIGIVFLLGLIDFLKALSLILGIVATLIGIIVGLRKLSS